MLLYLIRIHERIVVEFSRYGNGGDFLSESKGTEFFRDRIYGSTCRKIIVEYQDVTHGRKVQRRRNNDACIGITYSIYALCMLLRDERTGSVTDFFLRVFPWRSFRAFPVGRHGIAIFAR